VFKRKALALVEDLRKKYGEFEVELNPSAPRRGSFELVISRDGKDGMFIIYILYMYMYSLTSLCDFMFLMNP
jgi:hypothetical protein